MVSFQKELSWNLTTFTCSSTEVAAPRLHFSGVDRGRPMNPQTSSVRSQWAVICSSTNGPGHCLSFLLTIAKVSKTPCQHSVAALTGVCPAEPAKIQGIWNREQSPFLKMIIIIKIYSNANDDQTPPSPTQRRMHKYSRTILFQIFRILD